MRLLITVITIAFVTVSIASADAKVKLKLPVIYKEAIDHYKAGRFGEAAAVWHYMQSQRSSVLGERQKRALEHWMGKVVPQLAAGRKPSKKSPLARAAELCVTATKQQADKEAAETAYRQALSHLMANTTTLAKNRNFDYLTAFCLTNLGHHSLALPYSDVGVKALKGNVKAINLKASILAKLGRKAEAEDLFVTSLEKNATQRSVKYQLAKLVLERAKTGHDLDRVISLGRQALEGATGSFKTKVMALLSDLRLQVHLQKKRSPRDSAGQKALEKSRQAREERRKAEMARMDKAWKDGLAKEKKRVEAVKEQLRKQMAGGRPQRKLVDAYVEKAPPITVPLDMFAPVPAVYGIPNRYGYQTSIAPCSLAGYDLAAAKPCKDLCHVVYDSSSGSYYGLTTHYFGKIDADTGTFTKLKPPDTMEDLSWPCGLAVDTANKVILMPCTPGEGKLYSYAPSSNIWQARSLNNLDIKGLAYDSSRGLLYACNDSMGSNTFKQVYTMNSHGAVISDVALDVPIKTSSRDGLFQFFADKGYLLILASPTKRESYGIWRDKTSIYVINAASGKVQVKSW